MTTTETRIVNLPRSLRADVCGDTLCVYASVAIPEDDELYAPVRDFLASHPHRVMDDHVRVADDNMLLREAVLTTYRLTS